jgi:hypothetical protein
VLHSSENWTINARGTRRITAAEIKYVRKTQNAGYTWTDCTTNTTITEERNKTTSLGKIEEYRKKTGCSI